MSEQQKESNKDKEMEKLAYESQFYRQRLEMIQQQISALQKSSMEIENTVNALRGIGETEEEMYFPLGGGVHSKVKMPEKDNVLVDVGSGIVAERKVSDALEILDLRLKAVKDALEKMEKAKSEGTMKLQEIESKAQEHYGR